MCVKLGVYYAKFFANEQVILPCIWLKPVSTNNSKIFKPSAIFVLNYLQRRLSRATYNGNAPITIAGVLSTLNDMQKVKISYKHFVLPLHLSSNFSVFFPQDRLAFYKFFFYYLTFRNKSAFYCISIISHNFL